MYTNVVSLQWYICTNVVLSWSPKSIIIFTCLSKRTVNLVKLKSILMNWTPNLPQNLRKEMCPSLFLTATFGAWLLRMRMQSRLTWRNSIRIGDRWFESVGWDNTSIFDVKKIALLGYPWSRKMITTMSMSFRISINTRSMSKNLFR